ncbi:hypothetical protein [Paraburkholderia sp. GAS348]|uniref:hypothetical protein n=1 Tax=Paraburkholderia sp. GAS348 TaxID=3035132 RepID=UPI003D1C4C7F
MAAGNNENADRIAGRRFVVYGPGFAVRSVSKHASTVRQMRNPFVAGQIELMNLPMRLVQMRLRGHALRFELRAARFAVRAQL